MRMDFVLEHLHHLILFCHNDRIRVDDQPISDEDLLKYVNQYYACLFSVFRFRLSYY